MEILRRILSNADRIKHDWVWDEMEILHRILSPAKEGGCKMSRTGRADI